MVLSSMSTSASRRDPNAAQRARTLLAGDATALLVVPALAKPHEDEPTMASVRHYVDARGSVILGLSPHDPLSHRLALRLARTRQEQVVELRLVDVAPVAVPERIRARAWLHGWCTRFVPSRDAVDATEAAFAAEETYPALRIEIADVRVSDRYGEAYADSSEFAAAAPDPLAAAESDALQHLASAHRADLGRLWRGARREHVDGTDTVMPLALDRHALWLRRADSSGGHSDLRLEFQTPIADRAHLPEALATLLATTGHD